MAHVLLIDDSKAILETTGEMLRILGHAVVTASDGHEAIEQFRQQHFDLVITDMRMPGLNGAEVIGALRKLCSRVYIVASAGSMPLPQNGNKTAAQEIGADRLLEKPYSMAELKAAIATAVESAADA